MTDIDVPDWVAEKVLAGYLLDWADCNDSTKTALTKIMRESLRAAWAAWAVQEGWKYEGIYPNVPPFRRDRADGYTEPLYTLRQEKPE